VTLPARVVRAFLSRNYRSRRRRVQLREPIDRAGAPVNLRIRIALRASGNMEELAIVGFRGLVYAPRPRPIGIVSPYDICWRIGRRLRRSLRCMRKLRHGEHGEDQATRRYSAQQEE